MNGLGVFDYVIREQYDPSTGETYEAMTACNSEEMAERCKVKTANKVIWSIKANPKFNSTYSSLLRSAIQNGSINMLVSEFDAEEIVKNVPTYKNMSSQEKDKLLLPYIQTSMAINEMINLEHEIVGNEVRIKERSGMRKDRFSSLMYNNAVVNMLSNKLKPNNIEKDIVKMLTIRPAKKIKTF